jgi:hypothetical protein
VHERGALRLAYFEGRFGDVVVNMACPNSFISANATMKPTAAISGIPETCHIPARF